MQDIVRLAEVFSERFSVSLYKDSVKTHRDAIVFTGRTSRGREIFFILQGDSVPSWVGDFNGLEYFRFNYDGREYLVARGPANWENLEPLQRNFEYTRPVLGGLRRSFGFGDRLGVGTRGHILASKGRDFFPYFAQQSIREMARTNRSPQEVISDACWAVFEGNYSAPFGADADHIKTKEDIKRCFTAGFLMFTIDPGDYVDNLADTDTRDSLKSKYERLSWEKLNIGPDELLDRYEGRVSLPAKPLEIKRDDLIKAAVKYGRAIAHTYSLYQYLCELAGEGNFELEVSVDETHTPTSPQEHYYIASELKRLGIKYISLAPRFVGRFEKGVDYIGDLRSFREEFIYHSEIARHLGPYKISIHSGSDKLSIYPIVAELTEGLFHVKTAGTSYLEALRLIARVDAELFRRIFAFAKERYPEDRATYHVSAELSDLPSIDSLPDDKLEGLLDNFYVREVLHVTFGSVLTARTNGFVFKDEFMAALLANEELYWQYLKRHFDRHLEGLGIA